MSLQPRPNRGASSSTSGRLPPCRGNGELYFDDLRLEEFEPGIFFASNGETLDMTTDPPTWRSVPIEKHASQMTADAERAALERAGALYALLRDKSHDAFLQEASEGVRNDIGHRLPTVWSALLEAYGAAGTAGRGRVDVIGERKHVRLGVSFANGARMFNLMLDANDKVDAFWVNPSPPRSWHLWHAPSEPSPSAGLLQQEWPAASVQPTTTRIAAYAVAQGREARGVSSNRSATCR